jgi:hypothetical protein
MATAIFWGVIPAIGQPNVFALPFGARLNIFSTHSRDSELWFSLENWPIRLHNVSRFVTEEAATAIKPVRSRKAAGLLVTMTLSRTGVEGIWLDL